MNKQKDTKMRKIGGLRVYEKECYNKQCTEIVLCGGPNLSPVFCDNNSCQATWSDDKKTVFLDHTGRGEF